MQELKKYGIPATPSLRRAINQKAVVAEQKILCHVRALFDYHPYDDQLMPCPEAGLAFQFGDVLAILNQARLQQYYISLHVFNSLSYKLSFISSF